ncbi:MAG: fibronectin type III domain-containing protein, partial [Flavobacteriales bacterium]
FSYTIGINAETVSATPTASELLTQQAANGTAFNNTVQNNISTMPVANSQLTFTPVVPTADPSGLSFSSVTNTGMTLNWTDNATNEVGYVLYYSLDGINYYFQVQEAAGVSSSVITGLSPATNYFWRVYAVTEGALSNALTGNQITLAPGTIISAQNGRWANNATWVGGVQPSAGDNVLIRDNHMVTLRSNGSCNDLNIGEGASGQLRIGRNNSSAKFTLNMSGNLNIDNGGKINVRNTSNAIHDLNIEGNIVNNGTLAFSTSPTARCRVSFNNTTSNQLVSGTGNNGFHTINLSKGQIEKVLEITSADFSCSLDGLLFLGGGTFKFSSSGSISST